MGFVINGEKSKLSLAQDVVFLGLTLNSVTFTACLLEEQVSSFRAQSRSLLTGQDSQVQPVSTAARTDGFCNPSRPSGSPLHEGPLVLGGNTWSWPGVSRHTEGNGDTGVCDSATPVANWQGGPRGSPAGG